MGRMKPAGYFALRTPLLPLREFTSWADRADAAAAGDALTRRVTLRRSLAAVVERPEVREALFVASPDLDDTIDAWQREPDSDKGRRTERALVRYFARMSSRATPFGLFAGCSVGSVVDSAAAAGITLSAAGTYRRVTRLDMEYVAGLVAALERIPEVRSRLRFTPNNSIYRAAGRVRYVEAVVSDRVRQHRLVAVDDSPYLGATLAAASSGATIAGLAAPLVEGEITLEDAVGFVDELVESQLLVSDLEPAITGGDPLRCLAGSLRQLPEPGSEISSLAAALDEVALRLQRLDAGDHAGSASYREIATILGELPAPVALPRLFQVDMVKPAKEAVLGGAVVTELARAARLLHALMPVPAETALDRFRQHFQERYEGREVPLQEALDEELGIGFDSSQAPSAEASPLLRDLAFPGGAGDIKVGWNATAALLTRKLVSALRAGDDEIEITDAEVDRLAGSERPPLPDAFAVSAAIAAPSSEAVAAGQFLVSVQAVVGPSGARMLGRFCHTDATLETAVRQHLAAEEDASPGAVFAEIVHLPEGRVGNITMRPALRGYEIPYLGRSGAPAERQVPVSDLLVSVQGNEVVLRSRRLGRRVIPRMSSAHNYAARSVGVYRFLCSLQAQGVHGQLAWDWGTLAASPYLPRVRSGRVVLARRRWRLDAAQIKALQGGDDNSRHESLQRLAREIGLPRLFVLADSDNELLTDLDNPLSAETFVQLVARREDAILFELFPALDQLWVQGPEGPYASEVIVPFQAEPAAPAITGETPAHRSAAGDPARRRFPPGSEWLYLKLYCGTSTADAVLRDLVARLVRDERARGAFDRWFFIRYGDPDWHLRLRFHGDPASLAGLLVRATEAAAPLLEDGRLSRIGVDTYEPELARYGGAAAMVAAEALFEADSEAMLAIVELLSGDAGMDARWRLTLRGMDMLLDDLGLDLAQKRALARRLRDSYRAEFRADARFKGQVGDRYRKEARDLRALLLRSDDAISSLAPGFEILSRRTAASRTAAAKLADLDQSGELEVTLAELGASLIHMHANRLLRSAHRAQELVLYDFLDRLYMSFAARQ